jgi:hypothetical protein
MIWIVNNCKNGYYLISYHFDIDEACAAYAHQTGESSKMVKRQLRQSGFYSKSQLYILYEDKILITAQSAGMPRLTNTNLFRDDHVRDTLIEMVRFAKSKYRNVLINQVLDDK